MHRYINSLLGIVALVLLSAAVAQAVNQNANMTETHTTSDSLARQHCIACSPIIEGHVTVDSVIANKNLAQLVETLIVPTDRCTGIRCVPIGFVEGDVTVDSVKPLRMVHGAMSESLTVSDAISITKSLHIPLSEASATSDTLVRAPGRAVGLTEVLTELDVVARGQLGSLIENHPTVASLTVQHCINCGPIIEGHVTVDSISALTSGSKNVALTESHTTTDVLVGIGNHVRPSETHTTTDAVVASHGFSSALVETHATSDSLTGIHRQEYLVEIPHSLILQDSNGALWLVQVDTSGVLATTTGSTGGATSPILQASDGSLWQEGVSTSGSLTTTSVSMGTPVTPLLMDSSGAAWAEQVLPSGALQTSTTSFDSVKASLNKALLTETLSESDSVSPQRNLHAPPTETLTESDSASAIISSHSVPLTETHTTTDSLVIVLCVKFPQEILTTVDSLSILPVRGAAMTDTLRTITDSVTLTVARQVAISETLTISDAISRRATLNVSMTEVLIAFDAITTGTTHLASVTETHATVDQINGTHVGQQFGTIAETLTVFDSITVHSAHLAALSEILTLTDSLGASWHTSVAMTDAFAPPVDSISLRTGKVLAETLTTTSIVAVSSAHVGNVSEVLHEVDAITAGKPAQAFGNPVEVLTESDLLVIRILRVNRQRFLIIDSP